jgi:hypothetical protein
MASPFPGMDPYLEDPAFWADFKHTFSGRLSEAIGEQLPSKYESRLATTVHFAPMSAEMIELVDSDHSIRNEASARKRQFFEEVRQARIEILHRPGSNAGRGSGNVVAL